MVPEDSKQAVGRETEVEGAASREKASLLRQVGAG